MFAHRYYTEAQAMFSTNSEKEDARVFSPWTRKSAAVPRGTARQRTGGGNAAWIKWGVAKSACFC